MRGPVAKLFFYAGGLAVLACIFSLSLGLRPASTPAPPEFSPSASSGTETTSPISGPAGLAGLDPAAKPQGDIVYQKMEPYSKMAIYRTAVGLDKPSLPKYLLRHGRHPVWSPDGKQIAVRGYWFESDLSKTKTGAPDGNKIVEIAVVNSDGSGFRKLITSTDAEQLWDFAWSPDGRWIAVVRSGVEYLPDGVRFPDPEVILVPTDGSGILRTIGPIQSDSRIEWLPDSRHLVYLYDRWFMITSIDGG